MPLSVPYWPLHNAWFMVETNPYRSRLWPRGFSVLVDEEPIAAPTHTRAGRSVRKPMKYAPPLDAQGYSKALLLVGAPRRA